MPKMDNSVKQMEEIEALQAIYGDQWSEETGFKSYSFTITADTILFITLNEDYPTNSPPTYDLLAPNISSANKKRINKKFLDIYKNSYGMPILFQWIETLKEIVEEDGTKNDESGSSETCDVAVEDIVEFNLEVTHGTVIQDRKSIFQGHACQVKSHQDCKLFMKYLLRNRKIAQAKHNISAYRIHKSNNATIQEYDDDGEKNAGGRLLHLLQILNVENVMVIVTRWYGGIQLGPDRFRHINNAARQVLVQGKFIQS